MTLDRDGGVRYCDAVVGYLGERPWPVSLRRSQDDIHAFLDARSLFSASEQYVGKRIVTNPTNRGVGAGDVLRIWKFPFSVVVGFEQTERGPVVHLDSLLQTTRGMYEVPVGVTLGEKPGGSPLPIFRIDRSFAHDLLRRWVEEKRVRGSDKVLARFRLLASSAVLDD